MPSLPDLLQQGAAHAWLFVPTAIVLGALHGLEPGHSKTMMAAFIIAIRGTVGQAVLLGLSAALSHTAVVWVVALGGQYYLGRNLNAEAIEPYLQLVSAVIIVAIAFWMFGRTRRDLISAQAGHRHESHDHNHDHHHHGHNDHGHHDHGRHHHGHGHAHAHGDHHHQADVSSRQGGLHVADSGAFMDAHEREHADEISRRFQGGSVGAGQILLFGLTGGLIPCPAAITVLLLCLQVKELTLGVALVACFSLGLAITMVAVGVIASLSLHKIRKRWSGFDSFVRRAPYASAALMLLVAAYMAASGWIGLTHPFA
ncbi:MAG: nickel/cobalt efflux transporter RcnA [Hyphomicrobiales bacterium]|nr:nickel/cobalt efflux transporter RcnA [Hyphomicrobiales bacterium]